MPRLSWNEIQDRAVAFAARWQGETYEKGESQTFWSEFLTVYGIDRRRHGAFFEYAIKKTGGKQGFVALYDPLTMPPELAKAHRARPGGRPALPQEAVRIGQGAVGAVVRAVSGADEGGDVTTARHGVGPYIRYGSAWFDLMARSDTRGANGPTRGRA